MVDPPALSVCPAAKSVPLTERAPSSTADPGPEEPGAEPGSEPGSEPGAESDAAPSDDAVRSANESMR